MSGSRSWEAGGIQPIFAVCCGGGGEIGTASWCRWRIGLVEPLCGHTGPLSDGPDIGRALNAEALEIRLPQKLNVMSRVLFGWATTDRIKWRTILLRWSC
jgi:hypothetical protein